MTAGTIFHRTRTPLSTWFAAVWLVTSQKNGASAQNLHDMLGLGSYETAWAWLHKLRRAMVRPDRELLAGVVEVDESFVGGRATGRQGASTDKVPVMIAVENATHHSVSSLSKTRDTRFRRNVIRSTLGPHPPHEVDDRRLRGPVVAAEMSSAILSRPERRGTY